MSHPYTVTHLLDSKKFLLLKAKRLEKVSLTLLYLIKALHSLRLQIRPLLQPRTLATINYLTLCESFVLLFLSLYAFFPPFSPPPLVLTA